MSVIHVPTQPFTDLLQSGASTSEILTHGQAAGWENLISNRSLTSLTVHKLTDDKAALLEQLTGIEILNLKDCPAGNLSALEQLSHLRQLSIFTASKAKDFTFLRNLRELQSLEFVDVTKFKDVSILADLPSLRTLKLKKMFSVSMKLPTLAPLAKLKQLEKFRTNLYADDGLLTPLAELTNLKELALPLFYDLEEYAKLAAALPSVNCLAFTHPYTLWSNWRKCKRCGGTKKITLTRGRRTLCAACDDQKFQDYLQEFETLKEKVRQAK